jgi:hypothetical protein
MLNLIEVRRKLVSSVDILEREVKEVYSGLVLPHWGGELHGFPHTLYGYMMVCFSQIDLFSACWKGDSSSQGQTLRMIDFMEKYIAPNRETSSVAVQIWRHKLMHTGEPRYLLDDKSGRWYRWLLHWWEHLRPDQHFTFSDTSDSRILNLGLVYLISDMRNGFAKYLNDLSVDPLLQVNYQKVETELASQKFRIH